MFNFCWRARQNVVPSFPIEKPRVRLFVLHSRHILHSTKSNIKTLAHCITSHQIKAMTLVLNQEPSAFPLFWKMTSPEDKKLSPQSYNQHEWFGEEWDNFKEVERSVSQLNKQMEDKTETSFREFDPIPMDPSACQVVNQLPISDLYRRSYLEQGTSLHEFSEFVLGGIEAHSQKSLDCQGLQGSNSIMATSFYSSNYPFSVANGAATSAGLLPSLQSQGQQQQQDISEMTRPFLRTASTSTAHAMYQSMMQDDDSTTGQSSCNPPHIKSDSSSPIHQDRWEDRFDELRNFVRTNGHCHIPTHLESNPSLARWCKRQRYQYKVKRAGGHSTLSEEREQKLNDVNFVWDVHSSSWEERFAELIDFKTKYGHTNVPRSRGKLGSWVKSQRRQHSLYSRGEKSHLTLDRVSKMNSLGFEWVGSKNPFPRDDNRRSDASSS